ncbi:MAG: type II secretion system protein GspG [Planctomycetaceae bacterium]|nr:MAG: type II secretion system protein GspG [Planctomycetaceae bacterium]
MVRSKNRKGFTLVEIMVVILIVALLGTVTTVLVLKQREGAKMDLTRSLVKDTLGKQLELYNSNIGHYPTEEEGGLKALMTKPSFSDEKLGEKWRGPYVSEDQLKDAWGNEIKYELTDEGSGGKVPHIWSMGPDGTDGSEDDIRNWSDETSQ